jgi:hypothetical protein
MTAALLADAVKNFPTASITSSRERDLIVVGDKVYLPKRVVFSTVKLYKNDMALAKENDNIYVLCLDNKGNIVAEVPLSQVVQKLTGSNSVTFNGVKFVYCAKVVEKGKYFKVTVTLPIELKEKLDRAVNSGLFISIDQVVEFALRRLFRRRREL